MISDTIGKAEVAVKAPRGAPEPRQEAEGKDLQEEEASELRCEAGEGSKVKAGREDRKENCRKGEPREQRPRIKKLYLRNPKLHDE